MAIDNLNNKNAEAALLAGVLSFPEAIHRIMPLLRSEDDFYSPRHRSIYRAMKSLVNSNQNADWISVLDELNRTQKGEQWTVVLSELSDKTVVGIQVEYYAKIVAALARRRELIKTATELIQEAYAEPNDETLFDNAERRILAIRHSNNTKKLTALRECMSSAVKYLEPVWAGERQMGKSTGIHSLDWLIRLLPAKLYIIAARPGVGKSTFVEYVLKNLTAEGDAAALFSLEMDKIEIAIRYLSMLSGIDADKLTNSAIVSSEVMADIGVAMQKAISLPIYVDDSVETNTTAIRAKCRQLLTEVDHIGAIVLDYIQLVNTVDKANRRQSRERDVAEISRDLKMLSKEMNCPVIALSQLNRDVEKRADLRPRLSDLRESGAIEQDADQVIFLHRDKTDDGFGDLCEVIVAKNRCGRTGSVMLKMKPDTYSFDSTPDPADPYGR